MLIIDSHCHLQYPDFAEDFTQILANAQDNNVGLMLVVAVNAECPAKIANLITSHNNIYGTVGIHPHEVKQYSINEIEGILDQYAQHQKIVGIGETGLDLYYELSDYKQQVKSFEAHIEASRKYDLPVIIHTRSADQQTMDILSSEMKNQEFTGVIHCFTGSKELAWKALDLGLYISLSGIITFKKSEELQDIVQGLPIDRLLVETDSPYLAPVPFRGKRNEPSYTLHVVEKLADLHNLTVKEVAEITTLNFFRLFNKVEHGQ